jgi:hypothetical protein
MKHLYVFFIAVIILLIFMDSEVHAQTADDFRTNGNVTFAAATNWQRYNGATWAAAAAAPANTNGVITIRNGHTATVGATKNLDQVVVESGGILTHTGGTFTIANGTGEDIIVEDGGLFILAFATSVPTFAAGATITIRTNGILRVDSNGSGDADAIANNENAAYTGKTTFEHGAIFEWNTTGLFNSANIIYFPNANASTIPIFRITANVGGIGGGGTNITTVNGILEVNGAITLQNAATKFIRNGIIGTGTFTQASTSGVIQITGTNAVLGGSGNIVCNKTTVPAIQIASTAEVSMTSNKNINAATTATLQVEGILDCATFNLTTSAGTTNFTLSNGATLKMGSPQGITTSGATGNIQLSGTRTYNGGANYEYKGIAAQVTGNGLPAVLSANLTINNTNGVTQTNATHTIDGGQMILTEGTYNLNGKTFTWQDSNTPITRNNGTLTTDNTTVLNFGSIGNLSGNSFTLPNNLFIAPTTVNNFTVNRDNNLALGNQGLSVVGTLTVGNDGAGDFDLNGNNIDLGNTGVLVENRTASRVIIDNTAVDYDGVTGGFIRATNRNLNGANIAGLGIDITNGIAGTVNIDRYHCKVKGTPFESIKKVFDINASVAANNATMAINYSPQDLIGVAISDATPNFRLHKGRNGVIQPWNRHTSPAAVTTCHNTATKTVFGDNITSFSPWTAAPEPTILPVEFISFKARKLKNKTVELVWNTAHEEDNLGFEIQKGDGGSDFRAIAFVEATKPNNQTVQTYNFVDKNSKGLCYYRLKQIDIDKKIAYSKIISVENQENEIFTLFPNPFSIQVSLSYLANELINLRLVNTMGIVVFESSGNVAGIEQQLNQSLPTLAAGVYVMYVQTGVNEFKIKVMKE